MNRRRVVVVGHIPTEAIVVGLTVIIAAEVHHVTQIPQLDGLILAVADDVAAIPLRVQVGHAVSVAHQQPRGPGVAAKGASVPDLNNKLKCATRSTTCVLKQMLRVMAKPGQPACPCTR